LTGWAKQGLYQRCKCYHTAQHFSSDFLTGHVVTGVLLLNAVLTVQASKPNSHKDKGWEKFTDAVVSWLNANLDGVVFMLWGAYAQKKGSKISGVSISVFVQFAQYSGSRHCMHSPFFGFSSQLCV